MLALIKEHDPDPRPGPPVPQRIGALTPAEQWYKRLCDSWGEKVSASGIPCAA